jgi:hypothetical protein
MTPLRVIRDRVPMWQLDVHHPYLQARALTRKHERDSLTREHPTQCARQHAGEVQQWRCTLKSSVAVSGVSHNN